MSRTLLNSWQSLGLVSGMALLSLALLGTPAFAQNALKRILVCAPADEYANKPNLGEFSIFVIAGTGDYYVGMRSSQSSSDLQFAKMNPAGIGSIQRFTANPNINVYLDILDYRFATVHDGSSMYDCNPE